MRAVRVMPGQAGSRRLSYVSGPSRQHGHATAEVLSVGVYGTDNELVDGLYGPAGDDEYLTIGHEPLGRVLGPARELEHGDVRDRDNEAR